MVRFVRAVLISVMLGFVPGTALAAGSKPDQKFDDIVLHLRNQQFEQALNSVSKVLSRNGLSDDDIARALRYKGTAHLLAGDKGEALAAFSSALDFSPRDPWLLWRRCEVNNLIGFLASARRDCTAARRALKSYWAASLDQQRSEYLAFSISLTNADVQRKLGTAEQAIKSLENMNVPKGLASIDWRRQEKLGTLYFEIDQFELAKSHLGMAIDGSKGAPDANRAYLYFARGASHDQLKLIEAATSDFANAIELDPRNELYLFRACNFAVKEQQPKLSDKACSELVSLYPGKSLYQRVAAINEALSGRYADALKRFGGAIVDGHADLDLFGAIFEAAAYSANCEVNSDNSICADAKSE